MNPKLLTNSIRQLVLDDTGAGGLYETGAPLIKSTSWGRSPDKQSSGYPYLLLDIIDVRNPPDIQGFRFDGKVFEWQATVYTNRLADGHAQLAFTLADQAATLFNREVPTAPTGWSLMGPAIELNGPVPVDEGQDAFGVAYEFQISMTKDFS